MDEQQKTGELANPSNTQRILALEIRPRRIGFVVLQGKNQLLDWGVRTYDKRQNDAPSACFAKVATVLDLYSPAFMVIRRRNLVLKQRGATVRAIALKLAGEARQHAMKCQFMTADAVQRFFARYDCTTKDEIAFRVAEHFPDLAWRLPRPRKFYDPESYAMAVFDAAATAMAFIGSNQ